jgi:hypothetical protein
MRSKKAESWTISCPDRSVHQDLSPDGPIKGVGPFILAKSQVVRSDGISRQEGLGSIFERKFDFFGAEVARLGSRLAAYWRFQSQL